MSDVSLHIQSERKKTQTLVLKKQPYYSLVRDEKDYDFMRRLFTAAEVSFIPVTRILFTVLTGTYEGKIPSLSYYLWIY